MRRKQKAKAAGYASPAAAAAGTVLAAGVLMKVIKKVQVLQVQKKVNQKTNASADGDPQIDKSQ